MNELVGKYLNGFRIAKIEKDPFIENQINLWTDETKADFLGNREVVKFYIRDYPSGASIYQEQVDKEIARLNNIINECADEILKELNENHHLSYGVALSIRQKLIDYKELKGDSSNE